MYIFGVLLKDLAKSLSPFLNHSRAFNLPITYFLFPDNLYSICSTTAFKCVTFLPIVIIFSSILNSFSSTF